MLRLLLCIPAIPGAAALPVLGSDDPRTRRVVGLLCHLWLLNLADLLFTLWAHRFTPFHEANPVARLLLDNTEALVVFKLLTTGTGTIIFWRLRPYARAEFALWGIV